MHVAFLTPEYPHHLVNYSAGIGTSIKNLTAALIKEGIKVTIFVYGQKEDKIFWKDQVKICLIKNQKYSFFGWYFHRKFIQNYINNYIREDKIDILEAPDWTGITALMHFRIPLVIRFHGSDTYFCHLEKRKQKFKNFWFEKLAINRAQAFISPTKFAGEVSKKLFKIINKEIKTIHNGLDLKNFTNDSPLAYEKGMILYIGTLIRKKGVFELPEIFNNVRKEFPHAKLVLIGADSFDIKTRSNSTWQLMQNQFIKDDLKNVEYVGRIPYNEIQSYIKKANVCVFPTFAETLGMVTIECMSMLKAVVNSNIGWANELIVDEQSGFLVHPTNHELYAERIIKLLKNDTCCLKIGKQARKMVETKFDINKIVIQNIAFYKKTINQNL
jgi:glycosyltransferase involved in cell wall biosynthesis